MFAPTRRLRDCVRLVPSPTPATPRCDAHDLNSTRMLVVSLIIWCSKLLGAVLAVCILDLIINPVQRWRYRHVPGPAYRPIFGNLAEFREYGSHEFMVACRRKYGSIFKVWFGHRPWVVVADPELGRKVNYKLINRPRTLGDPLIQGPITRDENKGLFASRDNQWRLLHRMWQPAFYAESVHACAPLMSGTTQKLVKRLHHLVAEGQPVVNIWREVGKLTMSIVGTAAFGVDFNAIEDPDEAERSDSSEALPSNQPAEPSPASLTKGTNLPAYTVANIAVAKVSLKQLDIGVQLVSCAQTLFAAAGSRSGSIYQTLAVLLPPFPRRLITWLAHKAPDKQFKQVIAARATMSSASLQLVQQSRRTQQQSTAGRDISSDGGMKRWSGAVAPGSFLGLLLNANDPLTGSALTDLSLIMQATTFTMAGYETTANTLTFALFCVSTHPESEARILQEIRAAPRPFHSTDLEQQFPYTCACVSEALRLYPPGATTAREVGAEPLELGGLVIPPGSTVMVGTYVMQRDPELWPRAKEFVPERWLPGNEHLAAKHPSAYLPFGSGGRMCIGYRFALQEVRLGLLDLLDQFHFEVQWNLMVQPEAACADTAATTEPVNGSSSSETETRRDLKTDLGFTLSPAGGIWVKVVPRRPAAAPH